MSKKIEILELLLEKAKQEKNDAIERQNFEEAALARDKERKFLKEIEELKNKDKDAIN